MKAQICLLYFAFLPLVLAFGNHHLESLLHDFIRRESKCYQETPDCNDCLLQTGCTWCHDGVVGQCSASSLCPKESTFTTCMNPKPVLDNHNQENTDFRQDSVFNYPSFLDDSAKNVSCVDMKNCSFCTSSSSCSWCEAKRECFQFADAKAAKTFCGNDLWYKDQCLYSSTIKPCPQRTGGCKDCTQDKVCFWCKSSGNCSYYPHDAYVPPDCPADNWYYNTCTHMEFWVVLAPILAILLAPILIFAIIGIVLWCMKRYCGKDVDDADDASDDSDSEASPLPDKKMVLKHQPEPSRVDELRRKYNLNE